MRSLTCCFVLACCSTVLAQDFAFDGGVYLNLGDGLLPEEPAAGLVNIDTGALSWTTLREEGMNVSFNINNQPERQVYPLWGTYELVRFAHNPEDTSPLGARTSLGIFSGEPIWLYAAGEDDTIGSFQLVSRWESFVPLGQLAVVPEPNSAIVNTIIAFLGIVWMFALSRP